MTKYYTRIIGVFFLFVGVSLVLDLIQFGFRAETMHKIFHIGIGVIILSLAWSNEKWWKPFAIINGAFFTFAALFGILFPDFGNLDAFNTLDTILHAIVGISGLLIGLRAYKKGE